ncbi:MAG: helix-turn-helix transcriptional regulator [Rhodospirillaceae bacterium]|nr:helix-turn-helix transcriptional regulator [Rhodospirillaceae bacterium]
MARKEPDSVEVTESSGNVFADLGFDDPEEELARAKIAHAIFETVKRRRLTQKAAAQLADVDQPKISRILNGHLGGFSSDRLMRILRRLGGSAEVVASHGKMRIAPRTKAEAKKARTVGRSKTIRQILEEVRKLARAYYRQTGKPLGVTGELGEYLAAKHLRLTLERARTAGFDAKDMRGRRVSIKARVLPNPRKVGGQRIGALKFNQDWDDVILVIMDRSLEPHAMYRAGRNRLESAFESDPRHDPKVAEFVRIGRRVWSASGSRAT